MHPTFTNAVAQSRHQDLVRAARASRAASEIRSEREGLIRRLRSRMTARTAPGTAVANTQVA